MRPTPHPTLDQIRDADHALVRTVDALPDESYAQPTLLPGWTRGHVLAHLALNAEGLARVLTGAHIGEARTMYDSQDDRDQDIEDLAAEGPSRVRERLLGSTTTFEQAVRSMHTADWADRFERTPGGQQIAVASAPLMRWREVHIHHADLGADYGSDDWPDDFTVRLIESMAAFDDSEPFVVRATDLDRSWQLGQADTTGGSPGTTGPVVSGRAAALGWWLTGRGSGEGLVSDSGSLPRIASW